MRCAIGVDFLRDLRLLGNAHATVKKIKWPSFQFTRLFVGSAARKMEEATCIICVTALAAEDCQLAGVGTVETRTGGGESEGEKGETRVAHSVEVKQQTVAAYALVALATAWQSLSNSMG